MCFPWPYVTPVKVPLYPLGVVTHRLKSTVLTLLKWCCPWWLAFTYMSIWRPFIFKLPQMAIACISFFLVGGALGFAQPITHREVFYTWQGDFFNKMLILRKFHSMYPDCSYITVISCPPPPMWLPLPPNLNIKKVIKDYKRKNKFSVCYPYTHWSTVKLWVACPLSRTESFPSHTPTWILQCGEPALTSISCFIKVLLNCFLFRLLPFVGGWGGGRGSHRSLPHLSLLCLQSLIFLQI